jgi:thiol-disulfide isomerase/thioredoxin
MRAEPIVNGLEEEWGDSVQVVQVKIQDKENQALIERLDAIYTPTFVLFDAAGQEVWRSVGQIDADEVKDRVKNLDGA